MTKQYSMSETQLQMLFTGGRFRFLEVYIKELQKELVRLELELEDIKEVIESLRQEKIINF